MKKKKEKIEYWKTHKTKLIIFYLGVDRKSRKFIGYISDYDEHFIFVKDDRFPTEKAISFSSINMIDKFKEGLANGN